MIYKNVRDCTVFTCTFYFPLVHFSVPLPSLLNFTEHFLWKIGMVSIVS